MSNKIKCFYHPERQAIAQCKANCGKLLCKECSMTTTSTQTDFEGKCKDCIVKEGYLCGLHFQKKAVAICDICGKGICIDCQELTGPIKYSSLKKSLCANCVREMINQNSISYQYFIQREKKFLHNIIIYSGIWFAFGLCAGLINIYLLGLIWILSGVGYSIASIVNLYSYQKNQGIVFYTFILKGIVFLIFGLLTGPIIPIVSLINFKANKEKLENIIKYEKAVLKDLDAVYLNKKVNKMDKNELKKKILNIAENNRFTENIISVKDLKFMD